MLSLQENDSVTILWATITNQSVPTLTFVARCFVVVASEGSTCTNPPGVHTYLVEECGERKIHLGRGAACMSIDNTDPLGYPSVDGRRKKVKGIYKAVLLSTLIKSASSVPNGMGMTVVSE